MSSPPTMKSPPEKAILIPILPRGKEVVGNYPRRCNNCRMVMDRDVVAAVNLSRRGRLRFDRSQPTTKAQGPPREAMVSEREPERATLIRTVDGGKIDSQRA